MNSTDLATLSMSELKAICVSHSIEPVGDKRLKKTYINAIETFQSEQTVTDIDIDSLPAIPDPFEYESIDLPLAEAAVMAEQSTTPLDLYMESDGSPTVPKLHRQALIVMLTPLILLSVALIAIRIGIGALIPLIAAVGRLLVPIGRSITGTDRGTDSIPILRDFANDYFPA